MTSSEVRSTLDDSSAPDCSAPSLVPSPGVPVSALPEACVSAHTLSPLGSRPFGLANDDSTIWPSSLVCSLENLPVMVPSALIENEVSSPER